MCTAGLDKYIYIHTKKSIRSPIQAAFTNICERIQTKLSLCKNTDHMFKISKYYRIIIKKNWLQFSLGKTRECVSQEKRILWQHCYILRLVQWGLPWGEEGRVRVVPLNGNVNASHPRNIWDTFIYSSLWKQFGNAPSCSNMTTQNIHDPQRHDYQAWCGRTWWA